MRDSLREIGASEFVLLTTFRRSGAAVATPVWIAPDGEELLVTTGATSGKVKRLRHTARITLTPCDARGRTDPASEPVAATAVIDDSPEARDRLHGAFVRKYGMKYRLLDGARRLRRSAAASSVVLIIH